MLGSLHTISQPPPFIDENDFLPWTDLYVVVHELIKQIFFRQVNRAFVNPNNRTDTIGLILARSTPYWLVLYKSDISDCS